jgi:hypothetical protein
MRNPVIRIVLYGVPALIFLVFVVLMEAAPHRLASYAHEDGLIETIGAIGFALGALGFAIAAWRAPVLRNAGTIWARAITIFWALFLFLAFAEEMSWGQRIFGIETPEAMTRINMQNETNIHNIEWVNNFLGGSHRYLSLYMLTTGLLIPLIATTRIGSAVLGFLRFPVSPWSYSVLFVGAYLYHKYYRILFPIPDLYPPNAPTEIRETLVGIASAFFGLHAALWPRDVYLTRTAAARVPHYSRATTTPAS